MKTTIHVYDEDQGKCRVCWCDLDHLLTHEPAPKEHMGVLESVGGTTTYRIGSNNRDSRCDGAPYTEFFQASEGKRAS